MTEFGKLNADGSYQHIRSLPQAAMLACPHFIMMPDHYREDNSCKCDDLAERKRMIREWGYKVRDFEGIPLRTEE